MMQVFRVFYLLLIMAGCCKAGSMLAGLAVSDTVPTAFVTEGSKSFVLPQANNNTATGTAKNLFI